jgi:hypothetical protein
MDGGLEVTRALTNKAVTARLAGREQSRELGDQGKSLHRFNKR